MNITAKTKYGLLKSVVTFPTYPNWIEMGNFYANIQSDTPALPSIFVEVQEDTMQVPVGMYSILSEMMLGQVKAYDAMVDLCYNYFSSWDLGLSHSKSIRNIAKLFSVSHQYVQQALSRLSKGSWLSRLSGLHKTSKFEMTHHNSVDGSVPLDKDGRPLKCAMPRGEGGIFERMFSGAIHWKAALIWILLKVHSDWTTGITEPISIETLRSWTHFGLSDICEFIRQLARAGMVVKLERRPHEAQSYQLYPKPPEHRTKRQPEQERTWRNMRAMGEWRYSFNEEYRVNVETLEVQYRASKQEPFRRASDQRRFVLMPKSIRSDFDMACEAYHELKTQLRE